MVHYVDNKYALFPNSIHKISHLNNNWTRNIPLTREVASLLHCQSHRLVRKDWWLWQDTKSTSLTEQEMLGEEIVYFNTGAFEFIYAGQTATYT